MNFDAKGHEVFISLMQDQIRTCQKRYIEITTSFLTIPQQAILEQMVPKTLFLSFFGGYEQAERKVACLSMEPDVVRYPIVCLESKVDLRFRSITHRDILGALMNLGLEREVLGDFVIQQDRVLIVCLESIKDYIINQCIRIANLPVSFYEIEECSSVEKQTEEILVHAPSLRLDAVISSLAHVSRSDAQALIKKGFVKLNDIPLETNKQLCNNDFVSIRKVGRFQFQGIRSTTKKNRLILQFDKYI